jgi:L-alanine-DL-glutamate epimerase-like enolase superfamily enzyme
MQQTSVKIARIQALLYKAKVSRPVITSFGSLSERPALFLEVEDTDGARGWGEVWCNFPPFTAEHRARFFQNVIAPIFDGTTVDEPSDAARRIEQKLLVQAIQAGEEGHLSSLAAGLDQGLWDLITRRNRTPLWHALGGTRSIHVCASSIDPERAVETVAAEYEVGHRAFKLKGGFSDLVDLETVANVRNTSSDDVALMIDANQAWSPRQALEMAERLVPFRLEWLEEPIRSDEPIRVWRELSARSPIPLAAGENVRSAHAFTRLIEGRLVAHIQPDVGKWGGISECLAVGTRAVRAGIGYSPHWLGGGIGLAISLSLLAAVGGRGLGEIDVNPNPLREAFPHPVPCEGVVELPAEPGFGFEPDFSVIKSYQLRVT